MTGSDECTDGTEQNPDDGKAWFAERMWEEMPDDAKEQIRENRNDERLQELIEADIDGRVSESENHDQ